MLLIASYLFYSAWNPAFVLLLYFSTIVDWLLAKKIENSRTRTSRRNFLVLSLAVNLGLLGYFKYGEFLLNNSIYVFSLLGIDFQPLDLDIILPVGISFYTFQTLSYTIDVYRGKIKTEPSFLNYAMYVSFFPQLVAGPIVRAGDFLPQCEAPRRANSDQFGWGLSLIVFGLFMKIIMADTIFAPLVDQVYSNPAQAGRIESWAAIFAFSGQIFCDFSGYSTCAIGIALCFGFILPDNFNVPYAALGFRDFWSRWHMSLSSWLRDYLYISMGGNRISTIRTYINLMLTMLIGGLWHGASWLFVIWGGLHGIYLIIENIIKKYCKDITEISSVTRVLIIVLTYLIVSMTWVFFRSQSLEEVELIYKSLFISKNAGILAIHEINIVLFTSLILLLWQIFRRNITLESIFARLPFQARIFTLFSMLLIIYLFAGGDDRAFIYFQF